MGWARELGGTIVRDYAHDEIPWCALFANAVLREDGKAGTGTLWALDFARWGQKLQGPAVGAFAPMTRGGGGHVGIVVGRDRNGNLMCCGGNQSDAVNVKPFDRKRVVSYRWPREASLPAGDRVRPAAAGGIGRQGLDPRGVTQTAPAARAQPRSRH